MMSLGSIGIGHSMLILYHASYALSMSLKLKLCGTLFLDYVNECLVE